MGLFSNLIESDRKGGKEGKRKERGMRGERKETKMLLAVSGDRIMRFLFCFPKFLFFLFF